MIPMCFTDGPATCPSKHGGSALSRRGRGRAVSAACPACFHRSCLAGGYWSLAVGNSEAEHHAALHVLGDMAVRHPQAGVGDVEQDVHGLAIADQHRVLPDQVGLGHPVAGQHQEAPGPVQVEGVLHGMVHVVDQPDLDPVADGESPVDRGVGGAGRRGGQLPPQLAVVVSRLTAALSSSHSMPTGGLWPWSSLR